MVKGPTSARRLGRQDWLAAALTMVAETGIQGLKVQDLAASLGATTGSLYWHFRDRSELVRALVGHWAEASTEELALRIEDSGAPAEERLLLLMRLIQENVPTSVDLAIRAWAAADEGTAKVVRSVDARRAHVVSGLLRAMGLDEEEVAMRTHLLLCYESCERQVFPRLSPEDRLRFLKRRHRLFCSPLPEA